MSDPASLCCTSFMAGFLHMEGDAVARRLAVGVREAAVGDGTTSTAGIDVQPQAHYILVT